MASLDGRCGRDGQLMGGMDGVLCALTWNALWGVGGQHSKEEWCRVSRHSARHPGLVSGGGYGNLFGKTRAARES